MEKQYLISVILTTYQAENTVKNCIGSINDYFEYRDIEIIVVDDCSTDSTCEIVKDLQGKYDNINLYCMDKNTGSPSTPRNFGVEKATGKYITFIDDDDEIDVLRLIRMVEKVNEQNADFGKGYLIAVEGTRKCKMNKLSAIPTNTEDTIKNMIISQSMTQDFIVRRSLLIENNIKYNNDLKIGEDTVFISKIFSKAQKVIYINDYFLLYNKTPANISNLSSTQKWGDKEVLSQIKSWELAQTILMQMNINYYKLRLPAGFRNLLMSIIRFSDGISSETYNVLHKFADKTYKYIGNSMNLAARYDDLYKSILANDYEQYCIQSRRRLLIAGYDLKFITPAVKYLGKEYNVQIDEWTGHDAHNEEQSREMLKWADVIWCEWMLGNAVYYSKNKQKHQKLIVRAHRFEISRNFGNEVNWDNVDIFFAVGYYYYEQFINKFHIPRYKTRLLSNYVESDIYNLKKNDDYKYNIGMVGILPRRKGFLKGIQLLEKLIKKDQRYKLYVMGKSWQDISWIKNDPLEKEYYDKCEEYIKQHNLQDNIVYSGFLERRDLYCDLGYVLSLSDNELPESFHLAPAEASCAGCIGMLLNWPGVEYIYSKEFIYENTDDIIDEIIKLNNNDEYYIEKATNAKKFIIDNYSIDKFMEELNKYLLQVRIMS